MIRFLPATPIFSSIEFPAHKGPVNTGMNVGFNPINEHGARMLQIRVVYNLTDLYSPQEWTVATCQVNYSVVKPVGFSILSHQIMEVAQDVVQILRTRLSQVTNLERHLLELPPYPIERNADIIRKCVEILNRESDLL